MSYPLRLPAELDEAARERCKRLGISLNALIAVALDEYLHRARGTAGAAVVAVPEDAPRVAAKRGKRRGLKEVGGDDDSPPEGADRWKWFESPDVWPWVDPDPGWRAECDRIVGDRDQTNDRVLRDVDRAYWATRERPAVAKEV